MICSPKTVQDILLKSLSFTEEDIIPVLKSCNSPKEDNKALIAPRNCGKMVLQHSLSFKNWQLDENKLAINVSFKLHSPKGTQFCETKSPKPLSYNSVIASSPRSLSELDAAATKVQKVYKSYRTRRNLADCAVVVEELWWKALDFASLKRSSISFFNVEKQETAVSRWARARTRAAKVGKGLSKDDKAQKLALQHWLEAIDPRHRYGHNLHLYYDIWFESESSQPFFYWLDIGDGKEVNLQVCPRNKLQHQCIKYLGPKERDAYEVVVTDGKLIYRQSQTLVNTTDGTKWIFVLSTSRNLYIGEKKKGTFQHSSFLSGGATTAAGRLVAKDGVLKAIWPYSGHYHPTEENFKEFMCFLRENHVDLTNVKKCSVDDDEYPSFRKPKMEEKDISVEPLEADDAIQTANKAKNISSSKPKELDMKIIERAEGETFEFSKLLNSKWTSGAGARIGCVRDYPPNLQSMALEQLNLSPRLIPSPQGNKSPIPSPRPSPKMRLSPRIACMGFPTPTVSLKLPPNLKK